MTKQAIIKYVEIEIKSHKEVINSIKNKEKELKEYHYLKGALNAWERILEILK